MKNEKKNNLWINSYSSSSGNVNITVLRNDKVIKKINTHNTGTINICKYLRDAIAGDYIIADRPGLIVPCIKNGLGELENIGQGYTALFNQLPKKSEIESENMAICTLTFLIPSNIFSTGMSIDGFRLYSKRSADPQYLYAEVDLEKSGASPIEMQSGYNLKVEWNLVVRLVEQGD